MYLNAILAILWRTNSYLLTIKFKKIMAKSAKQAVKKAAATAPKKAAPAASKAPAKKAAAKSAAPKAASKAPAKKAAAKSAAPKAASKAPAKKAAAKGAPKKAARKPNAAFMAPLAVSAELGDVVGSKPLPRTEIIRKIWDYIKANGLQDSKNKRMINADDKLKKVFGGKKSISMFELAKVVNSHVQK
jgi:chromatin remodeling complex protein RSC6